MKKLNLWLVVGSFLISYVVVSAHKEISLATVNDDHKIILKAQYQHGLGAKTLAEMLQLTVVGWSIYADIDAITIGQLQTGSCGVRAIGCYSYYINNQTRQKSNDNLSLTNSQDLLTFGHEFLHAVYVRLEASELMPLQQALMEVYAANQQQLDDLLGIYRNLETDAKLDELHSYIGTEVKHLNPYLETHYAKYFKNRSAVLSFKEP